MKILFIGGTGTISMAITKKLLATNNELYLLNRGNRNDNLRGVNIIKTDINNEKEVYDIIKDMQFDVVADFIAFNLEHVKRDYRLFNGRTKQYIFISSASAYQKPVENYIIKEETPLINPYWEYSRNKAKCEEYLMKKYHEEGFPVTIIRPSHTYDERKVPLGIHGKKGSFQVVQRMLMGKPVLINGDGTSLWTMTHNSDFAEGFIGIMNDKAVGEAFHITSDESLTWNQIYKYIAKALNVEFKPYYVTSSFLSDFNDYEGSLIGDKSNTVVFDNSKIKKFVPSFKA